MKKRVLVIAKTEPSPSKKYGASVCTAGITDDGEFIRLYPVPFRIFCDNKTRFSKYDWIEVECEKADDDPRKESYKIKGDIKVVRHVGPEFNWAERNDLILPLASKNFSELEEKNASLGLVRPSEVLSFLKSKISDGSINSDVKEHHKTLQMIFEEEGNSVHMKPIPAISNIDEYYRYKFKCKDDESIHEMMCEDWELYESVRSWKETYGTDEMVWEKIYEKFFDIFINDRNLHFFVGTHYRWGTWVIIGVYYPPKTRQTRLFNISLLL